MIDFEVASTCMVVSCSPLVKWDEKGQVVGLMYTGQLSQEGFEAGKSSTPKREGCSTEEK